MTDLPPVRLTPASRAVLAALAALGRGWHDAAELAAAADVSVSSCRRVLGELLAAAIVQTQLRPGRDTRPARAVYQFARGGRALAESLAGQ